MKDCKCIECRFIVFFINSDIGCGIERVLYLFILVWIYMYRGFYCIISIKCFYRYVVGDMIG